MAAQTREITQGQRLGAEALGTFALTFVAVGADTLDHLAPGGIGHVARYVAPALMVTALIWTLSGISGAHFNPAVTLGFMLRHAFPARQGLPYIGAQLGGAALATLTLQPLLGPAIERGITKPIPPFTQVQALATEFILAFLLFYVIAGTAEEKAVVGKNSALAVGAVIAMCGLAFSPLSGASMNPARSLGPMIATLQFGGAWVYLLGPLLGASAAAIAVGIIHGPPSLESTKTAKGR